MATDPREDALDAGLKEAFDKQMVEPGESALDAIERLSGVKSQVLLLFPSVYAHFCRRWEVDEYRPAPGRRRFSST